jgi:hypothetical protein
LISQFSGSIKPKKPTFNSWQTLVYNRFVQHNLSGYAASGKEVMRMANFSFQDVLLFAMFVLALLTFLKKK